MVSGFTLADMFPVWQSKPREDSVSKEETARMKKRRIVLPLFAAAAALVGAGLLAPPSHAQEMASFPDVKHVLGLEGAKPKSTGTLTIEKGNLEFVKGKKTATVPAASITEVLTGKDSERAIGGTIGTMTMFAPYGSGRFLSLFRNKIDTLSLTYTDANGGIHGVVFTLPEGTALGAKKALVLQGAKTSITPEAEADQQAKPKEKKQ